MAPSAPQQLRAAFVRRIHGVNGELRIEPIGGDASRFSRGLVLRTEPDGRAVRVRSARDGGDGTVLLSLEDVTTPEQARALCNEYLTVDVGAARQLRSDEWFVWQLLGLRAVTEEGDSIGVVEDVEPGVANDVLVVRGDAGVRRFPMVRAFVQRVDVAAGVIAITPLPEDEA